MSVIFVWKFEGIFSVLSNSADKEDTRASVFISTGLHFTLNHILLEPTLGSNRNWIFLPDVPAESESQSTRKYKYLHTLTFTFGFLHLVFLYSNTCFVWNYLNHQNSLFLIIHHKISFHFNILQIISNYPGVWTLQHHRCRQLFSTVSLPCFQRQQLGPGSSLTDLQPAWQTYQVGKGHSSYSQCLVLSSHSRYTNSFTHNIYTHFSLAIIN